MNRKTLLVCCVLILGALGIAWFFGENYAPDARLPVVEEPDGFRVGGYRAPTPKGVTGATTLNTQELIDLQKKTDVVLVDVISKKANPRLNIKGSLRMAYGGKGDLTTEQVAKMRSELIKAVDGDLNKPIAFYCKADCWLSWNASKRALLMGFTNVYWYRDGTDGWHEQGLELVKAE